MRRQYAMNAQRLIAASPGPMDIDTLQQWEHAVEPPAHGFPRGLPQHTWRYGQGVRPMLPLDERGRREGYSPGSSSLTAENPT